MPDLWSASGLLLMAANVTATEPPVVPLWTPERLAAPPGLGPEKVEERGQGTHDRFVSNVTEPSLTVYLPTEDVANGAAVVICPGGGYGGLAIDKEGHDVARWLNTLGVAGIVLKYRMPRPQLTGAGEPWPLQDAHRALRLVRSRAAEWRLDPHRVGILGFSAGGHLASTAATHFDRGTADAADPVDRESCRPDFVVLCYPVVSLKPPLAHEGSRQALLGAAPDDALVDRYSNELQVTADTPPTFLVHARDDGVKCENSLRFHEALQAKGVPTELALYAQGGHGYGLGIHGGAVAGWPAKCAAWFKGRGLLDRPLPGTTGDYRGYVRHDFTVDGCAATVVEPKTARAGKPWIWRAEFFDAFPMIDLALLADGFHLAYLNVGNTFGCPSAMAHFDVFYRELTGRYGFSPKPVLEGLSRGGLYVYNWGAAHPEWVGAILADNPVCDFKSWPGGKGRGPGSPGDWQKLIKDYGFASEAEALAWPHNPIDNLAPLAARKVPLLHLAADADEAVPYEENTVVLKARYEQLGGPITVIVKHGLKHHPHGLEDPAPAVAWIVKALGLG